jgi:hypothetical protein
LREFFTVSPLWLRGATAFAGLLLCALGVITFAHLSQTPPEVVKKTDQEMYTRQQLEAEVKKAVANKESEFASRQNAASTTGKSAETMSKREPDRTQLTTNQQLKSQRSRGLTRREREQLAADLRLTPTSDDEELQFELPEQERPNQ